MATKNINLGTVPVSRGEFNSTTIYYKDNIVQYKRSSYQVISESPIVGIPPINNEDIVNNGWIIFAGTLSKASLIKSNTQDLSGNNVQENLNSAAEKLKELKLEAIYDISAHNNGEIFDSLSALLSSSNLSTLIPTSVRHGGMSIRFINSLDNKYVQYRYTGIETIGNPNPFLDNANWKCTDYTIIFENTEEKEFILPNILNKCGTIRSLAIHSFQGAQEGFVNEYMLEFTVSGDDFTLTLPEGVRWTEEPTWENGYTYQVSIVNNLAVFAGWEVQTNE